MPIEFYPLGADEMYEPFGPGLAEVAETIRPSGTQVELRGMGTCYFMRLAKNGRGVVEQDGTELEVSLEDLIIKHEFAQDLRDGWSTEG